MAPPRIERTEILPEHMVLAARHAFEPCTLDGAPAAIVGKYRLYATVKRVDGELAVELPWPFVDYVMRERGRAFVSLTS